MLKRQVGLLGAVGMGLGSILGTGVFVSIGLGAGVAGPSVVLSIMVAALLAMCNGLSSAQLAASHPVSGGTYEYGYRWLNPTLGFIAGWMFLCAKGASAATAALGCAGYFARFADLPVDRLFPFTALGVLLLTTMLVLIGLRRTNVVNTLLVTCTFIVLLIFIVACFPRSEVVGNREQLLQTFQLGNSKQAFAEACALMFVAFTGYGRIATLGEEVKAPERTIPRAIIVTLLISSVLYVAVAFVCVTNLDSQVLSEITISSAAPLEFVAEHTGHPQVAWIVSMGAVTAMVSVLLNLILGLSRVALAMGRRGDLPRQLSYVNEKTASPTIAVIFVSLVIGALVMIGNVKLTWSFSAFTVLIYYSLTNLAATRLTPAERLYSPLFAWCGLLGCMSLAFWVEPKAWVSGLVLIAVGLFLRRFLCWSSTSQD